MPPFEDNAPAVAAAVIVLTVLSAIAFPLRVHVRVSNEIWGFDDWCIAVAAVPFVALSAVCLAGSFNGVGVHEARLSSDEKTKGLMFFWLFEVFWCLSIIPTKLSISLMLVRIVGPMQRYSYILYAISALMTTTSAIALFYIMFRCDPVSYAWDTSIPNGHCQPPSILSGIYYAATATNILFDYTCSLLPIPLLWNLQNLNLNAKLSVAFLLGLGLLASLSACIRLRYTVNLTDSSDYLYSVANIVTWGYAEVGVGFFVACLATLRPLLRRALRLGAGPSQRNGGVEDRSGDAIEMPKAVQRHEPQRLGGRKAEVRSGSEEDLVDHWKAESTFAKSGLWSTAQPID